MLTNVYLLLLFLEFVYCKESVWYASFPWMWTCTIAKSLAYILFCTCPLWLLGKSVTCSNNVKNWNVWQLGDGQDMSIQSCIIEHFKRWRCVMRKYLLYNIKWKILKTRQKPLHAITWVNFENVMLSERIQTHTPLYQSGFSRETEFLYIHISTWDLFIYPPHPKDMFIDFRNRWRGRERETLISCLSYIPQPGIKPTT